MLLLQDYIAEQNVKIFLNIKESNFSIFKFQYSIKHLSSPLS